MSKLRLIQARSDFLNARDNGITALARGLVIQAVHNESDIWRIGLTASKKIGNSVCRNRARRRMRALARTHLVLVACSGVDYVLIARHDTITCAWPDLVSGLQKAIGYLHHKLQAQSMVSTL